MMITHLYTQARDNPVVLIYTLPPSGQYYSNTISVVRARVGALSKRTFIYGFINNWIEIQINCSLN